ncbi:GNAT family N-acetyltransferase [Deinococcus sp. VB343]|uniref:GNAT family N-acetyltransferase n=1 Tax=Deinococcus sp. VB142 TaxID=3112952 RepID=A0AAU6Q3Z0_9DEIO
MTLRVVPLDKAVHDREGFSCGVPSLDDYLKRQAAQDQKRDVARAFVLLWEGETQILGYYTLSSSGIDLSDLPEAQRKKLPGYPVVPAVLLGRLAVDQSQKGKGLGAYLLMHALERCALLSQEVAVYAVIVDALDDRAAKFYEKYGFFGLPGLECRLLLPIATIRQLLKF